MKEPDRRMFVLAIVSVALMGTAPAMIASLYHGFDRPHEVYLGAAGFVLFCGALALGLAALDRRLPGVLRLFLAAFVLHNMFLLVRARLPGVVFALWIKCAIVLGFAAVLLYLWRRIGHGGWQTLCKAISAASLIFAVSPLCIAWASSAGNATPAPLAFARSGVSANTLVLLLDETSPEATANMVRGLEQAGLRVRAGEVAAAGTSTLFAIPSMLGPQRLDDVAPCSGTAVCGRKSFDFAAQRAAGAATDIVAMFHPYCAIGGLRSCYRQENALNSPAVRFGTTLWCNQFNRIKLFSFCDEELADRAAIERARSALVAQAEQAPFWRQGGVLYVHLPLPHPSLAPAGADLKREYETNIAGAERVVARLAARLAATFGDDFTMLVTSDHPLRIGLWCASPDYAGPACGQGLPPDRGRVPFIVASPRPFQLVLPASNVGMLGRPLPVSAPP